MMLHFNSKLSSPCSDPRLCGSCKNPASSEGKEAHKVTPSTQNNTYIGITAAEVMKAVKRKLSSTPEETMPERREGFLLHRGVPLLG